LTKTGEKVRPAKECLRREKGNSLKNAENRSARLKEALKSKSVYNF